MKFAVGSEYQSSGEGERFVHLSERQREKKLAGAGQPVTSICLASPETRSSK